VKKYIYTLWTKPWQKNNTLYSNLLFLTLSIEYIKNYSNNILIYTDSFGEQVCNDLFNREIEIINSLDEFENLDINRWSIPKLYTINKQKSEFCHLDHDVFLLKNIPSYDNVDFTIQSEEKNNGFQEFYKGLVFHYISNNNNIPNIILDYILNKEKICKGINCGYLDFYNIEIAKQWTDFAINLNNIYIKNFRWIDCCFVEQFTLYLLTKENNYKYKTLFDFDKNDNYTNNNIGYIHLMTAKKEQFLKVSTQAEKILKKNNYERFLKLENYRNFSSYN